MTTETNAADLVWDPTDPAFRADPYPLYDALRLNDPIHHTAGRVVLTRYDDVVRLLRSGDVSRDIEANADLLSDDPVDARRRERSTAKTILNLDPPDHTRLRRLVTKAFTPRAVSALRGRMEEMVDGVLDTAAERGTIELIDDLAFPIPFQVISELLGIGTERADELREWSMALTQSLEPTASLADFDAADKALEGMLPYLWEVIETRRGNPGDDVLSALISVEEEGDSLSAEELIAFVILLYVAGHETTVNLIGNGMLALLNHPDQLDRWRHDPSLDATAVDELLRYDGPVQHTIRVPMVPMEFEGLDGSITVPPRQVVFAVLGAANHDPAVFADPHSLDLGRDNAGKHMAFASGVHYCLGASLAKLETTVALTRFIRRFDTIELTGEPHWRDRITIRGVDQLPLRLQGVKA